jgi:osmotically-inducible protein OsmY
MANGPYSPSGGYRNEPGRDQRDERRQAGSDRPSQDANVRGFSDFEREDGYGGRDDRDRFHYARSADGDRSRQDDHGYGDNDQSRGWARENYRANPSSFSYEPQRTQSNPVPRDRYASGIDTGSERGSERRDAPRDYSADRSAGGSYGSGNGGYDRSRDDNGRRGFMERAGDEVASWFGDEKAGQRRESDQHRGKGPKGYQRSDTRIEEDINDRLSDDPMLDASNISVTVSGAEVTLEGFVSSRWDKRRAEDLVEEISGVRHVQNNLRVNNGTDTLGSSTTV